MSHTSLAVHPSFVIGLQVFGPPITTQAPCVIDPAGASHWT
jgi:hypothetical protein